MLHVKKRRILPGMRAMPDGLPPHVQCTMRRPQFTIWKRPCDFVQRPLTFLISLKLQTQRRTNCLTLARPIACLIEVMAQKAFHLKSSS